jgi:hypothetical protein
MIMESLCWPIVKPDKANRHGSASRVRARLKETLIGAVLIMVRSGAVEVALRCVMHRER